MIVHVTADAVEVLDPDVFSSLSVRTGLDDAALREAIEAHEAGTVDDDGEHVWLGPALLLCMAAAGGDARVAGVTGMIEYAAAHDWIDEQGRVRAHIERAA